MKRLLKTFPDKRSGNEDIEKIVVEEIKEIIKPQIEESKEEISFKPQKTDDGFKLLISLMKHLRDKQNNKLLMICRQIQKIEIVEDKISLIAEESVLDEIFQNSEFCNELQLFFNTLNLSLKINGQNKEELVVSELKKWLGDKLTVK